MAQLKVLWISDFSIKHTVGGAQRSDDIIIKKGREIGHEITHFTHDSEQSVLDEKYDRVISANLEVISQKVPKAFEIACKHPNHSRLEHDMNRYLEPFERQRLFLNCRNAFFLTNYHHMIFKNTYGDFFQNVRIVPDPIDTTIFKNRHHPREGKILYVGFMHEFKGTFDFFTYVCHNPDKQFVVAGWGDGIYTHLAKTLPNVDYLGIVEHDKMPELYNSYTHFMYIPRIQEPFCRSAGEALLCGMNLAVNDKIGCVHQFNEYGQERFVSECENASSTFWSHIESEA